MGWRNPCYLNAEFYHTWLRPFSAHVVIDRGKYAGTWAHGNKGGHLYGTPSIKLDRSR